MSEMEYDQLEEMQKQHEEPKAKNKKQGYIAPEYAIEGLFSVKPDVYSFGVLLLEIAWHLWNENRAADLINPSITETCSDYQTELLRCIQVGVSCVQDSAASRPTMAAVVLMLESEIASLLVPVQPIFTSILRYVDTKFITDGQDLISSNFVTITMLDGR
ncbi:G-type lectin S-receptor-like serine/threonine-protein kinase B120 [Malus sylvestris]|uniref:G-type lectin S-receptor-like serine/threonine-protein kinase B120 n=1 Tax=Malus sylvestris TaxID=3752 RepID=UPI0021ABA721|nr:G-type lectin S-receptor-like serine/threonine-protein kinase B120 [Malus sylvestris]